MKPIILLALLLSVMGCSHQESVVIIQKEHNAKPSVWDCTSDSFTVLKNLITNERRSRCGNLGKIGDTLKVTVDRFGGW
jgi:hypothetical protein